MGKRVDQWLYKKVPDPLSLQGMYKTIHSTSVITATNWKESKYLPTVNKINKLWYIHKMEYYLMIKKRIRCWYTQQHSWISQIQSWIKEARHKSMHFDSTCMKFKYRHNWMREVRPVLTSRVWYWLRGGIREVLRFRRCFISSPWVMIIWVYIDVKIHWALCAPKIFLNFILMFVVYFSHLKV